VIKTHVDIKKFGRQGHGNELLSRI